MLATITYIYKYNLIYSVHIVDNKKVLLPQKLKVTRRLLRQ